MSPIQHPLPSATVLVRFLSAGKTPSSFTWLSEIPLDADRFMALFEDWPDGLMRTKGVVQFDTGDLAIISVARTNLDIQCLEPVDAGLPDDAGDEFEMDVTELIFIGRGVNASDMQERLEACQSPARQVQPTGV